LTLSLLAFAGFLVWSLVGGLVYVRFRRAQAAITRQTPTSGRQDLTRGRALPPP
jgi:uncharacterized membrane protein